MTQEQFHSFVRLVRKMHRTRKEAKVSSNGNIGAQVFSLSSKVDGKLHEFTNATTQHYEWQHGFVNLIKSIRKERKEYELTKYESQLKRCEELEDKLEFGMRYLEKNYPLVFLSEKVEQKALFA